MFASGGDVILFVSGLGVCGVSGFGCLWAWVFVSGGVATGLPGRLSLVWV